MKNITTILFDMDDTLILTIEKFRKYKNLISEKLSEETNKNVSDILAEFNTHDATNIQKLGLSPNRFITSWNELMETYEVNESLKKEINEDLKNMFEEPYEIMEGVEDLLLSLGKNYKLILITAGHYETQIKKINDHVFQRFFENVYIPAIKTKDSYLEVLEKENLQASEVVMVGNSLTSDIGPATDVGIYGIHLDKDTWAYDKSEVNNEYQVIQKITDLKKILL